MKGHPVVSSLIYYCIFIVGGERHMWDFLFLGAKIIWLAVETIEEVGGATCHSASDVKKCWTMWSTFISFETKKEH